MKKITYEVLYEMEDGVLGRKPTCGLPADIREKLVSSFLQLFNCGIAKERIRIIKISDATDGEICAYENECAMNDGSGN